MIDTKPVYVKADNFTIRKYFESFYSNQIPLYGSVWLWWKRTTSFWSIPLFVCSLTIFLVLLYQDFFKSSDYGWLNIVGWSLLPFIVLLPFIWAASYYFSFISPAKITRNLQMVIRDYFPGSKHVRRMAHNNYALMWNDLQFEIAYTLLPCVNSKGKVVRTRGTLVVCLFHVPDSQKKSELLNERGYLRSSIYEEWDAYCSNKESCKHLELSLYSSYFFRPFDDFCSKEEFAMTLEQMVYLTNKFGFIHLTMESFLVQNIQKWLKRIDKPFPQNIVTVDITIEPSARGGHFLDVQGYKESHLENKTWESISGFILEQSSYLLSTNILGEASSAFILNLVIEAVKIYASQNRSDENSMFCGKLVYAEYKGCRPIEIKIAPDKVVE